RMSRPTIAHTVKNTMSRWRRLLISFCFSSSASTVVCSTGDAISDIGLPPRRAETTPTARQAHQAYGAQPTPAPVPTPARPPPPRVVAVPGRTLLRDRIHLAHG